MYDVNWLVTQKVLRDKPDYCLLHEVDKEALNIFRE